MPAVKGMSGRDRKPEVTVEGPPNKRQCLEHQLEETSLPGGTHDTADDGSTGECTLHAFTSDYVPLSLSFDLEIPTRPPTPSLQYEIGCNEIEDGAEVLGLTTLDAIHAHVRGEVNDKAKAPSQVQQTTPQPPVNSQSVLHATLNAGRPTSKRKACETSWRDSDLQVSRKPGIDKEESIGNGEVSDVDVLSDETVCFGMVME